MGDDGTPNTTENQTQEMPPLPMHNCWKQAGSLWKLEVGGYQTVVVIASSAPPVIAVKQNISHCIQGAHNDLQQWNVCASEQRILSQLQQWLRAAACQTEEGVITTYANIRHADHIHELITAQDGHND